MTFFQKIFLFSGLSALTTGHVSAISMHPAEVAFYQQRMGHAATVLKQRGYDDIKKVPRVGVILSGGGLRAAIAGLGLVAGLQRAQISSRYQASLLDLVSDIVATSGSVWSLGMIVSYLANAQGVAEMPMNEILMLARDHLRENLAQSFFDLHQYNIRSLTASLREKRNCQQPCGVVDLWGFLLKEKFLKSLPNFGNTRLSDLLPDPTKFPMPIFTAVADIPKQCCCSLRCNHQYELIELNPLVTRCEYLNTRLPTRLLNSSFCNDLLLDSKLEPSLGFLFGVCGSAYSFAPKDIVAFGKRMISAREGELKQERGAGIFWNDFFNTLKYGRSCPPQILNFAYGNPNEFVGDDQELCLGDAGLTSNIQLKPLLQRNVDIIIICDAYDGNCRELKRAANLLGGQYNLDYIFEPPAYASDLSNGCKLRVFRSSNIGLPSIIYLSVGARFSTLKMTYSNEEFDQSFNEALEAVGQTFCHQFCELLSRII